MVSALTSPMIPVTKVSNKLLSEFREGDILSARHNTTSLDKEEDKRLDRSLSKAERYRPSKRLDSKNGDQQQRIERRLGDNFESMLKMLTVQLQNQDPLAPMDTTDFTNQIAHFTHVELASSMNKKLNELISLQKTNSLLLTTSFVGKEAEADVKYVQFTGDPVELSYHLPAEMKKARLLIKTLSGNIVDVQEVPAKAGYQTFSWKGQDEDGNPIQAGAYQVELVAVDQKQNTQGIDLSLKGMVRSIEIEGDTPWFIIGETAVGLNQLVSLGVNDDKLSLYQRADKNQTLTEQTTIKQNI